jgi:type IV secretory pathway VirD2 relaxase
MAEDEDFDPRLGRMRARGSSRGRKYLHRVLASAVLAGGPKRAPRGRFDGSRIGRGAAMARLFGSRNRLAEFRRRRAIVKTRLVRLGRNGLSAARAHLRYIQRDGVERDGSPGQLYDRDEDRADGKGFLARADGDRHQFRFIVSAEDGAEYDDLRPLVRRFMAQMEADLGTRLDWVAVDHRDTGHPHSHIMLRGRDDQGENLVIAREYIARGMRERLAELVTLDLGPRQDLEIRQKLRREMMAERLTSIDRKLVRDSNSAGVMSAGARDPFQHALRAGRLKKLETLGLAEPLGGGKWRLAEGIEEQLRRLGERGDIIRTMQRELMARGIERPQADRVIHGDALPEAGIVGQVIARGLSDEIADRHFLIVDGVDGRLHHIDIGKSDAVEALPEGAIVSVRRREVGPRASDRLVAEIAEASGGRYSVDLHLEHDPEARAEFAEAHVRRLEALRRAGAKVERLEDGIWRIEADHLDQAAAYERRRARSAPVQVELVSPVRLKELPEHVGATWLDRALAGERLEPLRDYGFGREVGSALALRRRWLLAQGLGEEFDGRFAMRPGSLAVLRQRELSVAAARLSGELGLNFIPAADGDRVEGILRRRVDLASGRFALVENGRDFTLVPWRPVLDRHLGKEILGVARHEGVSWTIGRGRGMER